MVFFLGLSLAILIVVFITVLFVKLADNDFFSRERSEERRSRERGDWGEDIVASVLGDTVDGVRYVYNDYRFRNGSNTIQIDHILVNHYGIFVIETKNISGTIHGNENARQWTQVLAGGNVVNKFYNPLKQNASHIYNLRSFLPKYLPINSVVVFIQGNDENIDCDNVIPVGYLADYIRQFNEEKINNVQIGRVAKLLNEHRDFTISEYEHVHNIQERREKIEQGICPLCGGKLVLRDGKYGEFYGCSNYPKCKFKKNAD